MKEYILAEKKFTLAKITPKRMAAYCKVYGIESFVALQDVKNSVTLGLKEIDITMDTEKLGELMGACLNEPLDGIDLDDIDVDILIGISNDFFMQRYGNLIARRDS